MTSTFFNALGFSEPDSDRLVNLVTALSAFLGTSTGVIIGVVAANVVVKVLTSTRDTV